MAARVERKTSDQNMRPDDAKAHTYIQARVWVDEYGWHHKGNPKYVQKLLESMELQTCNAATSPRSKDVLKNADCNTLLKPREHKKLRKDAGLGQYITLNRFDIRYSKKEILRSIAAPHLGSQAQMKREA